jgi:hypothetical protein
MESYLRNRACFSDQELEKYAGTYVAWSPDGTRVIASSPDLLALDRQVGESGYDPQQCVIEGIPAHDCLIGGGSLAREHP